MENRERTILEDKPDIFERLRQLAARLHGVGHFFLAFVLSGAGLLGYIRPFGICYAMSLDEDERLWGCAGAFLGSLMVYGREGMLYAAACILALAIDTFLLAGSGARELYLPLVLSAIIMAIKLPFAAMAGLGRLAPVSYTHLQGDSRPHKCYRRHTV